MNPRICVSKKITFAFMFSLFVLLFVLLGQITLQSNQAKNSRAATPTGVPIALPSPLEAPNCYAPAPKQFCLTPFYNSGTKRLELKVDKTVTRKELNKILNTADKYAVYRFNTMNERQKATHLLTLSSVDLEYAMNSTENPQFVFTDVSSNDLIRSTFVIFGIPTATTSLTECKMNTFVADCPLIDRP